MRRGQPQHHAAWVDSCAGARLTPAVGKPRCSRIARTPPPPFTYANTLLLPPHLKQANTSSAFRPAQQPGPVQELRRRAHAHLPLTPGQVTHVVTNWQGTCSSVTLATSNGWDTNFDNIELSPLP